MGLEALINDYFDQLNENERHITQYMLKNKEQCKQLTIKELADFTLTSKSSVLRLTQKLGFSGYSEFKYALRQEDIISAREQTTFAKLQETDLAHTAKLFDQHNIQPILESFDNAQSLFCYGTGWGQRDALKTFRRNLVPLQKFPILLESLTEFEMSINRSITDKDMVIIMSLSGNIKQAEKLIQLLKLKNVPILSITNLSNNKLATLATYNLYFQSTPVDYPEKETYSMLPLFQVLDSFYREYVDFREEIRSNK
jgi:RpiR family glv operon transcriptional regulator